MNIKMIRSDAIYKKIMVASAEKRMTVIVTK